MKTHSLEWTHIATGNGNNLLTPFEKLNAILSLAARIFVATVPSLSLVVGAAWAISVPEIAILLEAATWAAGFVFLALAVESGPRGGFGWSLATGLALPALALMSSRVAGEFLVIAAVILALWLASQILKRV